MSRYNSEEEDNGFINCAECLKSYRDADNDMKECVYCEDIYCNFGANISQNELNHYEQHMFDNHYVYYKEVVKVYTQHKSSSKHEALQVLEVFKRNERVIVIQPNGGYLYYVKEGTRGGGYKFDYRRKSEEKANEFLEELSA